MIKYPCNIRGMQCQVGSSLKCPTGNSSLAAGINTASWLLAGEGGNLDKISYKTQKYLYEKNKSSFQHWKLYSMITS
jgi:hypothetical protein